MWQKYFKFIKLNPGRVDTALLGLIDFSNPNIPLEKIQQLYENDFPYLEITPEGKKHLYEQDEQQEAGAQPEASQPEEPQASQQVEEQAEEVITDRIQPSGGQPDPEPDPETDPEPKPRKKTTHRKKPKTKK